LGSPTFRPRAGIASNNWLVYVTGGAAAEGIEPTVTEMRTTVPGGVGSYNSDDTRLDWTGGAGVEAAFGNGRPALPADSQNSKSPGFAGAFLSDKHATISGKTPIHTAGAPDADCPNPGR
jgi:hypothetical protein